MDKHAICLLTDSFPPIIDGVANAVLNYATYIEKNNSRAIVAAPEYPGSEDSKVPFQVVRFPSIDTRKSTFGYTTGVPFSPELIAALSAYPVDVLHSHSPIMSALLGRSIRKKFDVPLILTYHTKYDIDIANMMKSRRMQERTKKVLIGNIVPFDEVWVVSEGAGENLRSMGYAGDYVVMHNGVDFEAGMASEMDVLECTKNFDLPEGVPVFLFVGRMMWYKGIKITLDALKKLKDAGKDFRMVFVGTGTDFDEIVSYTKENDLDDKVIFTGIVEQRSMIKAWYTRADLFLFPSTFDTNGLVVREASACSLGSVLVRGSCAAENTTDGENAFYIDENADSMAAKLFEILKNPEVMRRVGDNAARDLYLSWGDAVGRAMERYEIVSDAYKRGEYEEHRKFMDNLLATSGNLMGTVNKMRRRRGASLETKEQKRHKLSGVSTHDKKNGGSSIDINQ